MQVRSIYLPGATFVRPEDSLLDAARKMRKTGQGCVAVIDGRSVAGIVTERDVTKAVAGGVPASLAHVADFTSDGAVTVSLNDECDAAEIKMLAIGCRNLPVVDQDQRLVGTISMRDVILKNGAPAMPRERESDQTWPEEPPPDVDSEGMA